MTRWEAYDGAWDINTTLSPRLYYAYAERDDEGDWSIGVEQPGFCHDVILNSHADVQAFIKTALTS